MPFRTDSASLFLPICRVEKESREVWGFGSSEAIAADGKIATLDASKLAFQRWAGNVREQHDPHKAVGRAVHFEPDEDERAIYVGVRVSRGAEDTWQKVLDGTLTGFSIKGPINRLESRTVTVNGVRRSVPVITDYDLEELSLVDVPSDPRATFSSIIRAAGIGTLVDDGDLVGDLGVLRGAPLHPRFAGTHSHQHGEYEAADGGAAQPHTHMHGHDGDANHGHDHEGVHGIARGESRQEESEMDEPTSAVQRAEMDENGQTDGPTHGAFDGSHTHPHAGSDGGTHDEEHSHDGDGDHGHAHEGAERSASPVTVAQAIEQAEALKRSMEDSIAAMRALQVGDPAAAVSEPPAEAVTRADGDPETPASAAEGAPDAATELTDADMAKNIIAQLRELVAREAAQYAAGDPDEVWDIQLLLQAIDLVDWFLCGELNQALEAMRAQRSREGAVNQVEQLTRAFAELTTTVEGLKAAAEESVQRAATAQQQEAQALREENAQLVERVARLETQPMPGGPVLRGHAIPEDKLFAGVQRAAAAEEPDDDAVAEAYQTIARSATATQPVREMAASAAAMTLMRQAQRNPQQMDGRAFVPETQE